MPLFVIPHQVPFTSSAPAGGAKAYFYRAGTTTHQPVYTTAALSVAHDQPVVASAEGKFAPVFLNPAATYDYRMILNTSADALIEDVDNIPKNYYPTSTAPVSSTAISYDRNAAETAASVTPVNYAKVAANPERYATNTTPGTTDMTTALTNAALVSDAGGGDIIIDSIIRVTANTTLPAGATLRFVQGGQITVDSGDTLTVNCKINAGRDHIFIGDGSVVYGTYLVCRESVAYPEWFGAVHDNSTNDRDAISKAIAMIAPAYGGVSLSVGYYRCTSSLTTKTRTRIFGVNYESVIVFAPSSNDDSLFDDDAGWTSDCIFDHFGVTGAGSATGKRAFTITSAASGYKWRNIDFSALNDWAISHDSAQHIDVEGCKFGSIHNATNSGVAIRTTTYINRATIKQNRFFSNDRDIICGGSGNALNIIGNGFESTGSLASVFDVSIDLTSVSGIKVDGNYFEAVRTATNKGVVNLADCNSGSVDNNTIVGDDAGTSYSYRFVDCSGGSGNTRGVRVNNNRLEESNVVSPILDKFIAAGNYAIEAHGNKYVIDGVQRTTYQDLVTNLGTPANIDLDLPLTFTWDPADLANGTGETSSGQAMTGATFGDTITVVAPYSLQGLVATAYVSASNTAVGRVHNGTGGNVNLASGTWKLFRKCGNL